jgi:hypothetical protein
MGSIGLSELIVLGVIGLLILGGVGAVAFLVIASQKPKP